MTTDLLAALLATQFLLSSHPAPPDPCGLVSSTEIASAQGRSGWARKGKYSLSVTLAGELGLAHDIGIR